MGNFPDVPEDDFLAFDAAHRRLRDRVWAQRFRMASAWTESMEMSSPLCEAATTDHELLNDGLPKFGFGSF